MKLADIGDLTNFSSSGKVRKVGRWSFYDNDNMERTVYHYGTEMGRFYYEPSVGNWEFFPILVGWGSVSDQQGMNRIIANYGWRYSRKNGQACYEKAGK